DQEPSKTYELVINKFAKKNQQWEFIVSMPDINLEHLNRLHFDIKGENFVKEAIISCLNESIESRIVVGEIFDFAAETNIRKTDIDLPDIKCQKFKILLSDVEKKLPSAGLSIQIDSKIANIKVNDRSLDNFKIERITATTNPRTTRRESFKSTTAILFKTTADEKGFQVVEVNPFYESNIDLQFEVANHYFHRNVSAYWTMSQSQESKAGSGTIYRIPNTTQSELRLQIGSRPKDATGLRLKIEKGSNPDLVLKSITSTAAKTFLYLIPESTDKLSISIGSPKLPYPTYETDRFLKNYTDVAQEAISLKSGSWSSKEISETIPNPHDKNEKTKNI
ncbi:MAG: hypothetical protein NT027_02955, partial [Proteobacteria bacterium]|nr:hypothetical protein [Pseudomonadota bacterium]